MALVTKKPRVKTETTKVKTRHCISKEKNSLIVLLNLNNTNIYCAVRLQINQFNIVAIADNFYVFLIATTEGKNKINKKIIISKD